MSLFLLQTLRYKMEEEVRVNAEIQTYLRRHHQVREAMFHNISAHEYTDINKGQVKYRT